MDKPRRCQQSAYMALTLTQILLIQISSSNSNNHVFKHFLGKCTSFFTRTPWYGQFYHQCSHHNFSTSFVSTPLKRSLLLKNNKSIFEVRGWRDCARSLRLTTAPLALSLTFPPCLASAANFLFFLAGCMWMDPGLLMTVGPEAPRPDPHPLGSKTVRFWSFTPDQGSSRPARSAYQLKPPLLLFNRSPSKALRPWLD